MFKTGFIGAGKTSAVLGGYLKLKGFRLCGYYSRTHASAVQNASITGSRVYNELPPLINDCDLIFITTPDDAIYQAASVLAAFRNDFKGKLIGILSGAHSTLTLAGLYNKGASVFSFHPPYTFPSKHIEPRELDNITFTLEGKGDMYSDFKRALQDAGIRYVQIQPEHKALYHTAACIAANYATTLTWAARRLLKTAGVNESLFENLSLAAVKNAYKAETAQDALTGPIARGDSLTVAKHLSALRDYDPELLTLYKTLGLYTNEISLLNDEAVKNHIKELLKDE